MHRNEHTRKAGARIVPKLLLLLGALLLAFVAEADAPGGFMESDLTSTVRPVPTPQQIQAFMPQRGPFTFPAPYDTQGIRITNSSDCSGGSDCLDYVGYPYWRNMNDSAGSNTLLVFLGLDRTSGGPGPTLFSIDKTTGQVTKVGPLFSSSSSLSLDTGEGWYFSADMPTKLYITQPNSSQLLRYDVVSHSMETVFDSTSQYPDTIIHQANSSNDDNVHSATLEQADSYNPLGCLVYTSSTHQFQFFPALGTFDECQVDKSGRYVVIKEKTPQTCSSCDEDNVIVDLQTGNQILLLDQNGAGGHSDLGYGWYLAADNWNQSPNAWRLWDLAAQLQGNLPLASLGLGNLLQGSLLYHGLNWNSFTPEYMSYENAVPGVPINQQYACGSSANRDNTPHANEIICFMLSGTTPLTSEQLLVVAPVMTDLDASGGNNDYAKAPKGNIDVTGQYFIWTSNLGGNRLDAFLVKIPSQVLTNAAPLPPPTAGPLSVAITSPQQGEDVSGDVTVSASAIDSSEAVSSVTLELDDGSESVTLDSAPYTVSWNTSGTTPGAHVLTAIAEDSAGDMATSAPVSIVVGGGANTSSPGGRTPPFHSSDSGGGGAVTGSMLLVLLLSWRIRHARARRDAYLLRT